MLSMERVRIGFIGAGWWATTNHMPLLQQREDVEMAGVARRDPELLRKVKEAFNFPYATTDYMELLDRDLDGVIVSSPHYWHYEHAKAALERGLHVLCEKPMTLNPQEAWDLVELAQQKNRHLLVPYGWHYKWFAQKAKHLMEEGVTGKIEYALCHMASPTKGFFAGDGGVPQQWAPTIAAADPTTWQVKEKGGGYAHGQITHSSGLLFWLTGLRAAEVGARMTSPNSGVDMYDSASVLFDGGSIGTISGAATLPDNDPFQVDLRIFGEDGVLEIDMERARLEVRRHDGRHQHFEIEEGAGAYSCEGPPNRFIDIIKGESTNDSPGEVGAKTVELIDAMHRSAAENGMPVKVYRR
jgi:predicted dehydrogenase